MAFYTMVCYTAKGLAGFINNPSIRKKICNNKIKKK